MTSATAVEMNGGRDAADDLPALNTSAQAELVPVGKLLDLVGRELRELSLRVDDMHVLVGGETAGQPVTDPAYIEAAQNIDLVSQHLAAIADFLGVLQLTTPPQWVMDPAPAARVVTLSALAARLGCPDAARALSDPAAGSELELF
jgi:hypothetical protein